MKLKEVIEMLEAQDRKKICKVGFGKGGSYRGFYDQIAFAPAENVSIESMLSHAYDMDGSVLHGYKGGHWMADEDTDCWIASPSELDNDDDGLTRERLELMLEIEHELKDSTVIKTSRKRCQVVNGDISDGYHTFDELYAHRCLLWITLLISDGCPGEAIWCRDHFKGWDLLACGNITTGGQMSYHVPAKYRYLYDGLLKEKDKETVEKLFDGHNSADVLERLERWCAVR